MGPTRQDTGDVMGNAKWQRGQRGGQTLRTHRGGSEVVRHKPQRW